MANANAVIPFKTIGAVASALLLLLLLLLLLELAFVGFLAVNVQGVLVSLRSSCSAGEDGGASACDDVNRVPHTGR